MKIAITGTTSGIGKALKDALSLDHQIFCFDRPEFDLDKVEDLEKIDLKDIDILINNAGHAMGGGTGVKNHAIEDWSKIILTNFQAPIYLTQKFIQQNNKGKIIFLTSKAIEKAIGGDSIYTASKAGLSMFIRCLRDELKNSSFTLSEICPGRIKTNFPKNRKIHDSDTLENFYDTRSHMTVEELVEIVKFIIDTDIVNHITIER